MASQKSDLSNILVEEAYVSKLCLCTRLRITSRRVTQLYDDSLREFDLRISQFSILAALKFDGDATITNLADSLGVDRTTLTRNLKPIERRALIKIKFGQDRRARIVTLTRRGNEILLAALPAWRSIQTDIFTSLGPENQRALFDLLQLTGNIRGSAVNEE